MKTSHSVTVQPGDDIFSVLRRWKATKPAGASDCIFVRFDRGGGRSVAPTQSLAA